jgi:NADH dehydrogenase
MGVEVREGSRVIGIRDNEVTLNGTGSPETLTADSILWTAGVKASPLGAVLQRCAGAQLDSLGRVLVEADLSIAGHPEVFVLGDLANTQRFSGEPLPGVAQVAMQSGKFVAALVTRRARLGSQSSLPGGPSAFRYRDLGSLATIGRAAAVGNVFGLRVQGLIGWAAWLLIHVLQLLQFENKLLVLTQWAWSYFTRGRSARLITGEVQK